MVCTTRRSGGGNGAAAVSLNPQTVEDVLQDILKVGEAIGMPEQVKRTPPPSRRARHTFYYSTSYFKRKVLREGLIRIEVVGDPSLGFERQFKKQNCIITAVYQQKKIHEYFWFSYLGFCRYIATRLQRCQWAQWTPDHWCCLHSALMPSCTLIPPWPHIPLCPPPFLV